MIELDNVTRKYADKIAVNDVSVCVKQGELFAFLGQNGAGKTTTIKMMVGLLQPTAGTVRIQGIDVAKQPRQANRLVGYVPDEPYLYEKLTGREFLQFVADIYGLPAAQTKENIARGIEVFGLTEFVDRLAESYSHGMRQRLVFASSMLHDPPVLVVDEPMVGLDPRSARMVKDLLQQHVRNGATVFMSTHTLSVAEEIADRIGVIDRGRLIFLGKLDDLRQQLSMEGGSLERLYLALTNEEVTNP